MARPYNDINTVTISPLSSGLNLYKQQTSSLSGYGGLLNWSTAPSVMAPLSMIVQPPAIARPISFLQPNSQQSAKIERETKSMINKACPPSVQAEFIRWKDRFILGEIEPESEYPDYPVSKRKRLWTRFLRSKWATYSWTEGYDMPQIATMQQWYTRFPKDRIGRGSASATPQRDQLRSSKRSGEGIFKKNTPCDFNGEQISDELSQRVSEPRKKLRFSNGHEDSEGCMESDTIT